MTAQLHAELASLCARFFSGNISEEEWALLQIHLAFCDGCHRAFLKTHSLTVRLLELDRGQVMGGHKQGTVEAYPGVYEPLKQLGVPAAVWDEVLGEIFHEPFGTLAPPFQELLFELEIGKADYPRPAGISDHDYVRNILKDTVAVFEAKGADHARLMGDDGWYYDETRGVRVKLPANKIN
jgi:hypothetical protein